MFYIVINYFYSFETLETKIHFKFDCIYKKIYFKNFIKPTQLFNENIMFKKTIYYQKKNIFEA